MVSGDITVPRPWSTVGARPAATPTCTRVSVLDAVTDGTAVRDLGAGELAALCAELRQVIVESVAANGGHLGSNLGAVELTVSLHRSFRSPDDVIVWDTGHQAYAHKLLTGRRDGFARLRKRGGVAGYPSRQESSHDWVENSHASTSLAYAYGMASATRHRHEDRAVVAVIGDGALTGGMAFEALNNISHAGLPVVVVVNDNQRSYSPTVSQLFDGSGRPFADLCRALSIDHVGPLDGHDIEAMDAAFARARDSRRPVVVHVMTIKGRGYLPAEQDQEKCLHDAAPFDVDAGPSSGGVSGYTKVFSDTLIELAERDDSIVALSAAMLGPTGLLSFEERFPERTFDVGIAEQHAVTTAAGMAMMGLRPFVAIYSTFFSRAFDQANLDVGLHQCPVVFVLDRAGVTGPDGPSHHGVLDLALLLRIPSVVVLAPSSDQELRLMLRTAATTEGPVAIRFPKGAARRVAPHEVGSGLEARRVRHGTDACLIGVGAMLEPLEHAARELDSHGMSCSVWDARCVRPVDEALVESALECGRVVTVEDGHTDSGAGASIAREIRTAAAVVGTTVDVMTLGLPTEYLPFSDRDSILTALNLDGHGLALTIASFADPVRVGPIART